MSEESGAAKLSGDASARAPQWTREAIRQSFLQTVPMLLGLAAFGAAVGTLAAQRNFTLGETMAMSGIVYAGTAQVATLQAWPPHLTLFALASLMLVTATVNVRFMMMSAALRPILKDLPGWQVYPALLLLVDGNWLLALRYYATRQVDIAFFVVSSLVSWVAFMAGTVPGYLLAASLSDPRRFGLDVVVPAFFVALLLPLWKGRRQTITWGVAGGVALVTQHLLGGPWFIVLGALAGAVTGSVLPDAAER